MLKKRAAVGRDLMTREYGKVLNGVVELLEEARRSSARSVNALMTATYWEIGRRIVEFEQQGKGRAEYGEHLLQRLSSDLTRIFGRGFSHDNLQRMRLFYATWSPAQIYATLSRKSEMYSQPSKNATLLRDFASIRQIPFGISETQAIPQTPSAESLIVQTASEVSKALPGKIALSELAQAFPLPWSHYVRLLSVDGPEARAFYEAEALRGGWSVRQLDRQISTNFYERTLLSRNKAALLKKGAKPERGEVVTPEEEIKDPLVLEFLGLKDEYSESDLEEALIQKLEGFLLELGGDFTFVGRQRRLRIGDEWYRIDLLFFHRKLRCLVIIDLKLGKFTHADAGQMHMYLNYAREHWILDGENPPVGLILCSRKDETVAKYALEGLPNKILAAEYKMALPDEKTLAAELEKTRKQLEARLPERK
jgi:predicted nuclease of restriction endonuclease-like (RecB) superfamily